MFDKTKRKIVFTVVFSLLMLIIVTMTTIYFSNLISTKNRQKEMLNSYVKSYSLDDGGESGDSGEPQGELPPPPPNDKEPRRNEREFRLSTFYSVAYSKTGDVLKVDNGNEMMQSNESLIKIASSVLSEGKKSGEIDNIYYLVFDGDDYTLVAMIDGTLDNDNQSILLSQILIIGTVATLVLFVVSIFIARRIVKPLEENDKRQKQFVSDAGHELKTPIAVISANSELLSRQIGENEWLSNINYENERMSGLVKELLFLSKAERGDIIKETCDFSKLIEGEVLPLEPLAFEKGKRIESEIEQNLVIDGNQNQLQKLVSILIDNALSYGTGETVAVSLKKERNTAVLVVSNNAEEINANQLEHLFDRFYRTDGARNEKGSHYGLGLSIAQVIVKAHCGEIRAEYKDKKAIFTISIPLKKN